MADRKTVIPFGPQHPVLPEPIQLRLVVEDERVVEAVPSIGYVHRGLEKLIEIKDFHQNIFVVERICGICSFMHALAYCQTIESMMDIEVPPRARFLRVVWSELHRMHSHLLWLGLLADSFGFESLFMQLWKIREKIMDVMEKTSGNRVIISTNIMGGVRRDIEKDMLDHIVKVLSECKREMDRVKKVFMDDYTVKHRTVGVGVLSKEKAYELGIVGPTGRGSGLGQDLRTTGYAAYNELDFQPVVEESGDCYARMVVRLKEVFQSMELINQAIAKMPDGEIAVPVKGNPDGEAVSRVEQPRGEVFYYIKANGTKNLERLRIRTPTFANVPVLLAALPGCQLADVPVITLSIDPCISCTER